MKPFLRDTRAEDPAFWEAYGEGRAELERVREYGEPITLLRILGALGSYARLLNRLEESVALLSEAVELSRSLHLPAFEAANLLRLGTTYQYADAPLQAEALFKMALDLSEQSSAREYRDFAWQHLGKLLVEKGLYTEARQCFEAALSLRSQKGDAELIASTRAALKALGHLEVGHSPSDSY